MGVADEVLGVKLGLAQLEAVEVNLALQQGKHLYVQQQFLGGHHGIALVHGAHALQLEVEPRGEAHMVNLHLHACLFAQVVAGPILQPLLHGRQIYCYHQQEYQYQDGEQNPPYPFQNACW